jgi:quercetin dioxygenase-like cupin family protein
MFAVGNLSYGSWMEPISVQTAEHYTWGEGCDGWHLVKTDELSVIEERMPPGTAEQRHKHQRSRQFFYVLSGELTMELEGVVHTLGGGAGLEVSPGIVHQAINSSREEVRFLVVSQPRSHGDRLSV